MTKRLRVVGTGLVLVAIVAVGPAVISPAGPSFTGPARIIDGDTLVVRGLSVRLYGIDAPESMQHCLMGSLTWPCGRAAVQVLSRRIGSREVSCEERDQGRYGRVVAVCRVGGEDVNVWMVAEGWAFAYSKYSKDYVSHETAARAAKRGIWRGEVIAPWEWRKGKRFADTKSK